jgi:hypothetical protein
MSLEHRLNSEHDAMLKLVVHSHAIKPLGEVNIGIAHEDMNHGHGNNPLAH